MKKIIYLFPILIFLTSCVGISFVTFSGKKIEGHEIYNQEKNKAIYIPRPNKKIILIPEKSGFKREYYKNDLIELWGEPKKITKKENSEEWLYKRGINFKGVMPIVWVIIPIPIPLVVPVGRYDIRLEFDNNDKLVEIFYEERTSGKTYILFVCGIEPSSGDPVCYFLKSEN